MKRRNTRLLTAGLLALVLSVMCGVAGLGSWETKEVQAAQRRSSGQPEVPQASAFSLRMEDSGETEEAVEEKVMDPVLENYIQTMDMRLRRFMSWGMQPVPPIVWQEI